VFLCDFDVKKGFHKTSHIVFLHTASNIRLHVITWHFVAMHPAGYQKRQINNLPTIVTTSNIDTQINTVIYKNKVLQKQSSAESVGTFVTRTITRDKGET
jgi:hypothetical protein